MLHTCSLDAPLLCSFGICGGRFGSIHVFMLPLWLNSGIVWEDPLQGFPFCRMCGMLGLPFSYGRFG